MSKKERKGAESDRESTSHGRDFPQLARLVASRPREREEKLEEK